MIILGLGKFDNDKICFRLNYRKNLNFLFYSVFYRLDTQLRCFSLLTKNRCSAGEKAKASTFCSLFQPCTNLLIIDFTES